ETLSIERERTIEQGLELLTDPWQQRRHAGVRLAAARHAARQLHPLYADCRRKRGGPGIESRCAAARVVKTKQTQPRRRVRQDLAYDAHFVLAGSRLME